MTWALVALALLLASMLVPAGIWLHAEVREGKNLRDRLDAEQERSAEYKSGRDVLTAKLAVATDQLETALRLKAIAEAQRNEAQSRAHAYLARNLANASEKDIANAVQELFAAPLSLVPGNELERP